MDQRYSQLEPSNETFNVVAQVPFGLIPRYWDGRMWNVQSSAKPYSSKAFAEAEAKRAYELTRIPAGVAIMLSPAERQRRLDELDHPLWQ